MNLGIKTYLYAVRQFILRVLEKFHQDECALRAASLAYYGLFSIFPVVLFLIYMGSAVLETEEARLMLRSYLKEILPIGITHIEKIIDQTLAVRGSMGVISGITLLWGGSAVFGGLESALNVIWNSSARPFLRRRLLAAISLLSIGVLFIASFLIAPNVTWVLDGHTTILKIAIRLASELGLSTFVAYLIFRVFPNREVKQVYALLGAFTSALMMLVAQYVFRIYVSYAVARYGYVYGSLAWIVALGLWVYLVVVMLFLGAEVGATLEEISEHDAGQPEKENSI